MSLEQLVRQRRPAWDRLAGIVAAAYRRGLRRISGRDANDMIHLYREVSADLARLRSLEADPLLVEEINRLVTRAHAQIYRDPPRRPREFASFFLSEYPRLFRETWRFTLASFILSALFAGMAYRTVQTHPEVVADLLGGAGAHELRGERTVEDIRGRFRIMPHALLGSFVTWNNIKVALNAFALGITFGIGTAYVLMVNGIMVGGFAGAYARSGIAREFWMTILPHGALELSAIVIAGGSGLFLGYALWCPGQRTRRRALREDALKAVRLVVGLIPAFMVAGFIEGFITPNDRLPDSVKVLIGLSVAGLFWSYLLLGGRAASMHPTSIALTPPLSPPSKALVSAQLPSPRLRGGGVGGGVRGR